MTVMMFVLRGNSTALIWREHGSRTLAHLNLLARLIDASSPLKLKPALNG